MDAGDETSRFNERTVVKNTSLASRMCRGSQSYVGSCCLSILALAIAVTLFLRDLFFIERILSSQVQVTALNIQPKMTKPSVSSHHRILCYGDSLTAGTTDGYTLFPYAPFLEKGLRASGYDDVKVRHLGLPGWTAELMVASAAGEHGLMHHIRRIQDPGLSLVIIMAGTNDVGYMKSKDEVTNSLLQLHQIALENHVPATLAVGIPPSGYTSRDRRARLVVEEVNQALLDFSEKETRMKFAPFPFQFEQGGENWSSDGLHFSQKGYQLLGEQLVTEVMDILDQIGR